MNIIPGDLDDERVTAMLAFHARMARAQSPPASAHAFDPEDFRSRDIGLWTIWEGETVRGVGAIMQLNPRHVELKSMYVDGSIRGRGLGGRMLRHLLDEAGKQGFERVSLETGSMEYFETARRLYQRHGFVPCEPFGKYVPDPNSLFMTLDLRSLSDS